jgi:hypothetical protein
MAANVLLHNVLQTMGLLVAGANAVIADGLSDFDDLAAQSNDNIKGICKSIRKPGSGGAGEPFTHTAESNAKLLAYYLRH